MARWLAAFLVLPLGGGALGIASCALVGGFDFDGYASMTGGESDALADQGGAMADDSSAGQEATVTDDAEAGAAQLDGGCGIPIFSANFDDGSLPWSAPSEPGVIYQISDAESISPPSSLYMSTSVNASTFSDGGDPYAFGGLGDVPPPASRVCVDMDVFVSSIIPSSALLFLDVGYANGTGTYLKLLSQPNHCYVEPYDNSVDGGGITNGGGGDCTQEFPLDRWFHLRVDFTIPWDGGVPNLAVSQDGVLVFPTFPGTLKPAHVANSFGVLLGVWADWPPATGTWSLYVDNLLISEGS
jgi:hypothetical protein